MGWWRTRSGSVIGDAPADILEEALESLQTPEEIPPAVMEQIRLAYQEGLSRDPTTEELTDLVGFCFGSRGG